MENNYFGITLKKLRLENKLSQKKFGEIMGVVNQTVSTWEVGKREPDYDTLIKIAEFFQVSVGYLLGTEEI